MNEKTFKARAFLSQTVRGFLATALSLLMVPYGLPSLYAQAPPPPYGQAPPPPYGQAAPPPYNQGPPPGSYSPLGPQQLNQLVAPIALYPDSLVAQILTASTYPQQVNDANNWLAQTGGMPPGQRAQMADQMPWDPSVKALTAFPQVLNNMAQNYNWTGALGNAYYNQPGDVMNAVQAMRMQAQAAGTLRSDPHYSVISNGGLIVIQPVNPGIVYVPYYNPWGVYGPGIVPWGGYVLAPRPPGLVFAAGIGLGFAAGISLALFAPFAWGFHSWAPNWHGGVVVYNHTTYVSRSTTVINHGYFGGYNRGVYEHPGPGVPGGFHPPVTSSTAAFRPGAGAPGGFRGSPYANHPAGAPAPGYTPNRSYGQPTTQTYRPQANSQSNPQQGRQYGQPNQPRGNVPHQPPASGAGAGQPAARQPAHSVASTPPQHQQGNNGGHQANNNQHQNNSHQNNQHSNSKEEHER